MKTIKIATRDEGEKEVNIIKSFTVDGINFAIHKDFKCKNIYVVTEVSTGYMLCKGNTIAGNGNAIPNNVQGLIDYVTENVPKTSWIKEAINKINLERS